MKKHISLVPASDVLVENEIRDLKAFLETQNLEIDPEFYNHVQPGDIIEVYSFPQSLQLYSNAEFFKLCSYTKEQMQTIPFPELFWRSPGDHQALMDRARDVSLSGKAAQRWNLPNHELVESLHPRRRTFEMSMGWLAPGYDKETQVTRAWITTLKVELIFEWEQDLL